MPLAPDQRRKWLFLLLAACLLIACRAIALKCCPNLWDEGYLVQGVSRYLAGQTPGADFHAYAPGRYIIIGAFFHLFGLHLLVARIVLAGLSVILGLLIVKAVARAYGLWWALLPLALFCLWPGPWHKLFLPLALLIYAFCWNAAARRLSTRRRLLLGGCVALCFFLRVEAGVVALVWSLATLIEPIRLALQDGSAEGRPARGGLSAGLGQTVRTWLLFLCGLAGGGAILTFLMPGIDRPGAMAGFYLTELTNPFIANFFHPLLTPLAGPVEALRDALTEGRWFGLAVYIFLAAILVQLWLLVRRWERITASERRWQLLGAWLAVFGLWQVAAQPDSPHFLQGVNLWHLSLAGLLSGLWALGRQRRARPARLAKPLIIAASVLTVLLVGRVASESRFSAYYSGSPLMALAAGQRIEIEGQGRWRVEEDQAETFEWLARLNGELPDQASLAVIPSGPLFNFLLQRRNPLGCDLFYPHVLLNPVRLNRLLAEWDQESPDYLVLSEDQLFFPSNPLSDRHFNRWGKPVYDLIRDGYHWVDFTPGWWLMKKGGSPLTPLLFQTCELVASGKRRDALASLDRLKETGPHEPGGRWEEFLAYLKGRLPASDLGE